MPTIAFISPKGGVGKTTAATILATQLARRAPVIVIDADPNRPVESWAKLAGAPAQLTVVSDVDQDSILDQIDTAAQAAPFVIVDCEGTASLTVAYAISAADLVIVPTQGSQLDAKEAARALSLVKKQERTSRRQIPHAVLLTRTAVAVRSRSLVHVQGELQRHGVRLFESELNEREAFRAMFSFGGALESLDPTSVRNIDKAVANARAFANEVLKMLRDSADSESREGQAA
ncbi:ParA family protein [Phenylobacterium sp. CCH9-H3]|uniref:ParA family protein n=2 Tax=unclassified Phenylobacterium TaxID=2640670 RepID=UPI00083B7C8A|nr:ParA family protein [Phenylobacterium sp. CCH9-H3]